MSFRVHMADLLVSNREMIMIPIRVTTTQSPTNSRSIYIASFNFATTSKENIISFPFYR